MDVSSFLQRVWNYAEQTNIEFIQSGSHRGFSDYGLPDTRGFTPHLRQVRLYQEDTLENLNLKGGQPSQVKLWLTHDLLHILFYDFIFFNVGESAFSHYESFLEFHLASEAFAVWALDYQVLAKNSHEGLAIQLDQKQWREFQKSNPKLPSFGSQALGKDITQLYLTGHTQYLQLGMTTHPAYEEWVGHELRYSEKQRLYAQMWWDDLQLEQLSYRLPEITKSYIDEAVMELTELLLFPSTQWESYLKSLNFHGANNFFQEAPKYQKKGSFTDYRFTPLQALSFDQFKISYKEALEIKRPSASDLFFFYQLITKLPVSDYSDVDLNLLQNITQAANRDPTLPPSLWESFVAIVRKKETSYFKKIDLNQFQQKNLASVFFLP